MTNNFLQRFIARLAIPIRKRKERRERARDMLLKATRRPSSAHKVTNSHTLAENHRKGTGPTARKAPHNISLQKASATGGVFRGAEPGAAESRTRCIARASAPTKPLRRIWRRESSFRHPDSDGPQSCIA